MFVGSEVSYHQTTQRGTGYPSWGHPTQLRISSWSAGLPPAKNATKPNPFKIIPLQPTRKENNLETEKRREQL